MRSFDYLIEMAQNNRIKIRGPIQLAYILDDCSASVYASVWSLIDQDVTGFSHLTRVTRIIISRDGKIQAFLISAQCVDFFVEGKYDGFFRGGKRLWALLRPLYVVMIGSVAFLSAFRTS